MLASRHPLRALKERTADLHALAEQYVRILDEDASVADYVRYLRAMHGFHAPMEEMFARDEGLASAGFAALSRQKSSLLVQDLRTLDAVPLAACNAMPAAADLPALIGCAYVIEGSTLGGKYILARLPERLAPLRGRATAFLDGYGAATGAQWKAFASLVDAVVTTDTAEASAVAGARATFASLIAWLAQFESRVPERVREAS